MSNSRVQASCIQVITQKKNNLRTSEGDQHGDTLGFLHGIRYSLERLQITQLQSGYLSHTLIKISCLNFFFHRDSKQGIFHVARLKYVSVNLE